MYTGIAKLILMVVTAVVGYVVWHLVRDADPLTELDELYPTQRDSYLDNLFGFG